MPSEQHVLDPTGKVALVTGAASGIGLACARRLTAGGAKVAILDIDQDAGERAAEEIGAIFIQADVADSARVAQAFTQVRDTLGGLDIAHLNAGIYRGAADIDNLTDPEY